MTRHATPYGAFHIEPVPSQPQIAICHGLFVSEGMRGQGLGHMLKATQETQLKRDLYDYAKRGDPVVPDAALVDSRQVRADR